MSYLFTFCLVFITFIAMVRDMEIEYKKQKGILLASIITIIFLIIRSLITLIVRFIF